MEEDKTQIKKSNKEKAHKKEYFHAVGKRKEAVARVRLYKTVKPDLVWGQVPVKKGEILVNEHPIAEYFPSDIERMRYTEPLRITNTHQQNYAMTIRITGGGRAAQLDAVVLGIAKALNNLDRDKHRPILKKKGFLTRDARVRQRRNIGMGGKSRRKKQSPKR